MAKLAVSPGKGLELPRIDWQLTVSECRKAGTESRLVPCLNYSLLTFKLARSPDPEKDPKQFG